MPTLRALPAFTDNYIWTLADGTGRALIVDPGEAPPVLRAAADGLQPVAILLTHHHNDHIGGAAELLRRFDIPCIAPHDARIPQASRRVRDGEHARIDALNLDLETIETPGHTLGHVAFHATSAGISGLLFCGDTLFSLGCGRLFEGSPAQMLASLDRLSALPDDTAVCCAHEYTLANGRFAQEVEPGNASLHARIRGADAQRRAGLPTLPTTLASERACNPFLRVDQPAVRAAVAARLGRAPRDRVETFAVLRRWKDDFVA